jgi:hypothetical protein
LSLKDNQLTSKGLEILAGQNISSLIWLRLDYNPCMREEASHPLISKVLQGNARPNMYCDASRVMPREGSEIVKRIVRLQDFDRSGRSLLFCHGKNVPPLCYWPTILTRANRISAHSKGSSSRKIVLFNCYMAQPWFKKNIFLRRYPREKRASAESASDTEARTRWKPKRVLF